MEHASILRKQAYLQEADRPVDLTGVARVFESGDLVAYLKPHRPIGLGLHIDGPGIGSFRVWDLSILSGAKKVAAASFSEFRFVNGLLFEDAIYAADCHTQEVYESAELASDVAKLSGCSDQFQKNFRLLSIVKLKIADAARGQLVWKLPLHAAIMAITARSRQQRATYWLAYQALPLIPDSCPDERLEEMSTTIRTPRRREALRQLYARHIGVDQIVNDGEQGDGWMVRKLSPTSKRNSHVTSSAR